MKGTVRWKTLGEPAPVHRTTTTRDTVIGDGVTKKKARPVVKPKATPNGLPNMKRKTR
jgi:hypothetical protein